MLITVSNKLSYTQVQSVWRATLYISVHLHLFADLHRESELFS